MARSDALAVARNQRPVAAALDDGSGAGSDHQYRSGWRQCFIDDAVAALQPKRDQDAHTLCLTGDPRSSRRHQMQCRNSFAHACHRVDAAHYFVTTLFQRNPLVVIGQQTHAGIDQILIGRGRDRITK